MLYCQTISHARSHWKVVPAAVLRVCSREKLSAADDDRTQPAKRIGAISSNWANY